MRELAERLDLPTAIAATTAKAPAKSDTDSRDGENGLKRDEGGKLKDDLIRIHFCPPPAVSAR